jgi:hypothetical protein
MHTGGFKEQKKLKKVANKKALQMKFLHTLN